MNDCFMAITLAYWLYFLIPIGVALLLSWISDKREERRFAKLLEEERARVRDSEIARTETAPE
ncbi:hypothetical protein EU799_10490 [Corynebacterium silvaticum]|uniref:hypothetical protein n=1 Tax=Corynebacterium silvaticum TaxID=2320431 RepID=UPI00106871CC|nr:hypothetical protein [Corynebacterium silvaticum]MBH5299876.1 hypothetical protein [Corynebacterium silvaticum]NOM65767.1 hypothetical protein [Corynebacterium silvaticum]TFA91579.1 hypothetical protein EU802_10500 [Corynebacterium silvaticum]TFA92559.1 hypothetical protein EU799_10490 [Corynebacterium silvaticum]TNX78700.1 hypothetical protein FIT55_10920 [Corynebacterium silvaticum]